MKLIKLCMALLLVAYLSTMPNFASTAVPAPIQITTPIKVLFLDPSPNSPIGAQTKAYLMAPFKFPFYKTVAQDRPFTFRTAPTLKDLRDISHESGADLVLVPVIERWHYRVYEPRFAFYLLTDYDPETYVAANAKISLYSYFAQTDDFRKDSASYSATQELFMAPSEEELLQNVTDKILQTLPYKRVPNQ